MDVDEHRQVRGLELSWRIHQHAFDVGAVVGNPVVEFAFGQIALGEKFVEGGNWPRFLQLVDALGDVNLSGFSERRVHEGDARRVLSGGNRFVNASPARCLEKRSGSLRRGIHLLFGSYATCGYDSAVECTGILVDSASEIASPALGFTGIGIDPVEAGLGVFVFAFYRTVLHIEEDMLAVPGPKQISLYGLVVGDLSRRADDRRVGQVDGVDLEGV